MMLGADISVTTLFFQALLPATLGNMFGGGLMFAAVQWYSFDAMNTGFHMRMKKPASKSDEEEGSESKAASKSDEEEEGNA
jgi:hypothetical protein